MKRVNKERAIQLVNKGAMLVDMRSPVEYRDGSIAGAANLPLKNFLNKIVGLNRKQKFVLFSGAIDDPELGTASNYAEQLGFPELFVTEYKQLARADVEEKTE
jgi:hypothetical protein